MTNPFTRTVTTEAAWPEPTGRGYHNFALVLKDGRVLIGGGKDATHDTACEKNELRSIRRRTFRPGRGPRSRTFQRDRRWPLATRSRSSTLVPCAKLAGSCWSPGAVTHSFNAGQRYVPLTTTSAPANGSITVALPATVNEAPPGDYILHAISDLGVPSGGIYVRLNTAEVCAAAAGNCVVGMTSGGPDAGLAADASGVDVGAGAAAEASAGEVPGSVDSGPTGDETVPPSGSTSTAASESGCSCALNRREVTTTRGLLAAGLAIAWAASRRERRRFRTCGLHKRGRLSSDGSRC